MTVMGMSGFCKIQPEYLRAALHQRQCLSYEAYTLTYYARTHSGCILQAKACKKKKR
jgi:hypothetical protein